jgi:hypothetical protein
MTSIIDTLSLTASGERSKVYDPVRVRRKKLAAALEEQLHLFSATQSGERYKRTRVRRHRDLETDRTVEVERQSRVSPWWWVEDDGAVKLSIRYGSARLALKPGMDTLIAPKLGDLPKILAALRQEALAGNFDAALASVASGLQGRFKGAKKAKA